MPIDVERFWQPDEQANPGVPEADFAALESRHQVEFPATWKRCLARQDGGRVRYTELELHELSHVQSPSGGWWKDIDDEALADRERVFELGFGSFSSLLWLAPGALTTGATGVVQHFDATPTFSAPVAFDAFFDDVMRVEPEPPFEWPDTDQLDVVLVSELELVEQRPDHAGREPQPVRQILARHAGDQLALYSHVQEGFQSDVEFVERALMPAEIGLTHIFSEYGVHCMDMGPVTERLWAARMFDGTWQSDPYAGSTTSLLFAKTREELRRLQLDFMPGADMPPFL